MDALTQVFEKLESLEKILKATQAEIVELKASMSTEWLSARVAAKELGFRSVQGLHMLLERDMSLEPGVDWKQKRQKAPIFISRIAIERLKKQRGVR